jgi:hypothetical protein
MDSCLELEADCWSSLLTAGNFLPSLGALMSSAI